MCRTVLLGWKSELHYGAMLDFFFNYVSQKLIALLKNDDVTVFTATFLPGTLCPTFFMTADSIVNIGEDKEVPFSFFSIQVIFKS